MDANTLGQQVTDLQTRLGQYGAELPGQIKEEVRKAWSPSLQEASNVVGQRIKEFLPSYYGMAEKLGGTTAADISPTARLTQMGNYLGELGGGLSSAQRYADYLGANMKSAYGDALNAMQMGQQGLQQQYQNIFGQYQMAKQLEEAEKDRRLQRSLSGGGGGGYADFSAVLDKLLGGSGTNTIVSATQVPPSIHTQLQKSIASKSYSSVSGEQRKKLLDQTLDKYLGAGWQVTPQDYAQLMRSAGFSSRVIQGFTGISL